jgi:hypothetical protein
MQMNLAWLVIQVADGNIGNAAPKGRIMAVAYAVCL